MSEASDVPSDAYDSDDDSFMDGDMDDDADYEVADPPSRRQDRTKGTTEYTTVSSAQLQARVDDEIRHVASVIGLETPIASILLRHFNWNKDRLIEKFLDDSTRVLGDAGEPEASPCSPPSSQRPTKRIRLTPTVPPEFVCGVCYDDEPPAIFGLRCDHPFCEPCWEVYVTSKIKEEGQSTFLCMKEECPTVVDEPSVQKLVEPEVYQRFKELLLQQYVSAHQDLRFCPHPSCTETVSCTSATGSALFTAVPTVECGAKHAFCFGCGQDYDHRPLICKFTKVWENSAREDAGTSQWIKANTRNCPKCENSIEKNGGCNRIMCRNCNFQFCWLCMKNWEQHGYNNEACGAWKEPEPDDDRTAAKLELDKWLFYFDRFNNHELSARLDQELVERTEEKMLEVQERSEMSWIETKFMQEAVDELTRCRVTLKWSYAMAYFLAAGNQKQIFEDIQADLEKAVEELSQLLEEPVEAETVKSLRARMLDKTVYVRMRHQTVLEDTADGLAQGRWEWKIPLE